LRDFLKFRRVPAEKKANQEAAEMEYMSYEARLQQASLEK
jgi:hypothetical protein